MPIDLHSSIKHTSQWVFGSPLLNTILSSSIFIAIVISFIMVLLLMVIYPAKPGTSLSVVFKLFIYMLLSTVVVVFLHDSVVKYTMEEEYETNSHQNITNGTMLGGRNLAYPIKQVQPNILGGLDSKPPGSISVPNPINPVPNPINPVPVISTGGTLNELLNMTGTLRGPKPTATGGNPYQ